MQKASAIKLPRVTKILFIVNPRSELIRVHGAHVAMVIVSEKLKHSLERSTELQRHRTCWIAHFFVPVTGTKLSTSQRQ